MEIDTLQLARMSQYAPLFYRFARNEGIDTYRMSILFTIYNSDALAEGQNMTYIAAHNSMSRPTIILNMNKLVESGHVSKNGRSKQREYFSLTQLGINCILSYIDQFRQYTGGKSVKSADPFGDGVKRRKDKIKSMASNAKLLEKISKELQESGSSIKITFE